MIIFLLSYGGLKSGASLTDLQQLPVNLLAL